MRNIIFIIIKNENNITRRVNKINENFKYTNIKIG